MRPVGEVRQAILSAAASLATPDRCPTLLELAGAACVGREAARRTIDNMTRAGELTVPRTRKVEYRNRPVAEYAPAVATVAGDGFVDLGHVLSCWLR